MTAVASTPGGEREVPPSRRAWIAAVTRNGPASISTQAMTPPLSTQRTTPVKRLRRVGTAGVVALGLARSLPAEPASEPPAPRGGGTKRRRARGTLCDRRRPVRAQAPNAAARLGETVPLEGDRQRVPQCARSWPFAVSVSGHGVGDELRVPPVCLPLVSGPPAGIITALPAMAIGAFVVVGSLRW